MNRPNLFKYATSELSQDAFICWLLEWAAPEYSDVDLELHECGRALISALFAKHGKPLPKIEKVDVFKQDKHIDVLCIINETYPILIEDKVGTKNHSDQLKRYISVVKSRKYGGKKVEEKNIVSIYFKTEDQARYCDVLKEFYQPFLRDDFLKVLDTYKGDNAILIDYKARLQLIEDSVEAYKKIKLGKWGWYAWIGFYKELHKQVNGWGWGYVHNGSGGFLGFDWLYRGTKECKQYLQIEQVRLRENSEGKLCFKINVDNASVSERAKLRMHWHSVIQPKGKEYGLDLVRPQRFGNGKYMTVCHFNGDFREATEQGLLDMQATVARVKKAEALLKSVSDSL